MIQAAGGICAHGTEKKTTFSTFLEVRTTQVKHADLTSDMVPVASTESTLK